MSATSYPRRYSLAEIDAMREGFSRIHSTFLLTWRALADSWEDGGKIFDILPGDPEIVERELRTALMAGVDPAEVEDRANKASADLHMRAEEKVFQERDLLARQREINEQHQNDCHPGLAETCAPRSWGASDPVQYSKSRLARLLAML